MTSFVVDLSRLKHWSRQRLPGGAALQRVILAEKDELPSVDFVSRIPLWLNLVEEANESQIVTPQ
jgi:hypothetical protein